MKSFLKYWLIKGDNPNKYLFDLLLIILISISVILAIAEQMYFRLPDYFLSMDIIILLFFFLEYIAGLYICTDFRKDCIHKGLWFAVLQKVKWMCRLSSVVDLLAIIPSINYFKAFRLARYLRLFRGLKLLREIKMVTEIHKLSIILKGMREESRVFYVFFSITFALLSITSLGLYLIENKTGNDAFSSYTDTLWYVFKTLELADDTPNTLAGKLLSIMLLFSNMAIFGFFISIIINKIKIIMDAFTSGKITSLKLKDHIVICGYTKSSQTVITELLKDKKNYNNIVLITDKEVVDISGVLFVKADYTECRTLENINIYNAKNAIVFAESNINDAIKDVDLRTVMTVFHIEKMAPHVHTIAEINDQQNAEIILDKINGDEIIFKELIDAKIINNCIRNPNISNLFYELFGDKTERIQSTALTELEITHPTTVQQLKHLFADDNKTFLGVIDSQNNSYLSPPNHMIVDHSYQLFYLH